LSFPFVTRDAVRGDPTHSEGLDSMMLKLLLLLTPLSIALQATPDSVVLRADSLTMVQGPNDNGDITGAFGGVTFDHEGWAWFSIGTSQLRMKSTAFPDPVPYPGTIMTATGCTPDPFNPGTYVCTGLH
jgi:hypothetical protein